MKTLLSFLFIAACFSLFAQQTGNHEAAKSKGNYNQPQPPAAGGNHIAREQGNYRAPEAVHYTQLKAQILGENLMQFDINAMSNQKATSYVAIFNVTQIGATAKETDSLLNVRYQNFKKGCLAADLAESDIFMDMVSFLPKYEIEVNRKLFSKKSYNEIPKGFILQKNIHIKLKNNQLLDKLITIAAQNEIYDLVKVDYFIENPVAVYNELREKAFLYLKDVENAYIKNGFRMDSAYRSIGENAFVVYPNSRYISYEAYSSTAMDLLDKDFKTITDKGNSNAVGSVDKNANIVRTEKQTTSFYQALPQNEYEVVINPVIHEPVVQFVLNLQVRYVLKERVLQVKTEIKREKEFIWITPDGNVRTLKID
ncbi:MAG: SIMPL domain-containing protein [Bacteroidia bacterium]